MKTLLELQRIATESGKQTTNAPSNPDGSDEGGNKNRERLLRRTADGSSGI